MKQEIQVKVCDFTDDKPKMLNYLIDSKDEDLFIESLIIDLEREGYIDDIIYPYS